MNKPYIQNLIPGNHCFGCGPENHQGLQIKSYQQDKGLICHFTPKPQHTSWVTEYMNGGVIASIIDCHCIWTAIADRYEQEKREIGSLPNIIYVTANLNVDYLKPTPSTCELELFAEVVKSEAKKSYIECTLSANKTIYAKANVLAVRVKQGWI